MKKRESNEVGKVYNFSPKKNLKRGSDKRSIRTIFSRRR